MIGAASVQQNRVVRQNRNEAMTLYCYSCAGASASAYTHWRRALPPSILVRTLARPLKRNESVRLAARSSPKRRRYSLFKASIGFIAAARRAGR